MQPPTLRAVLRSGSTESSTRLVTLVSTALLSLGVILGRAAVPFNEATVTRLQNKVTYGASVSATRPAAVQDVVRATNYLLTENDSRAELQYPDGSIARLGQNTIFSFQADARTMELKKGAFIFYVPKGQGGGLIKTPSLTAAITGTVGKVSENMIAILEGSVELVPSGRIVKAGQFARANPDGTITIDWFDKKTAFDGKLMSFNGPLPPFREEFLIGGKKPELTSLDLQETFDRTANQPGAQKIFNPPVVGPPPVADKQTTTVFVPPPTTRPPQRPRSPY